MEQSSDESSESEQIQTIIKKEWLIKFKNNDFYGEIWPNNLELEEKTSFEKTDTLRQQKHREITPNQSKQSVSSTKTERNKRKRARKKQKTKMLKKNNSQNTRKQTIAK